ncbi:hypothetical protein ABT173_22005 [Streptomyces sp. NPDC001795]|uniref:hypothetical protein n=1 Tax=Streptomyces sp. NPDC001795 TaxID=3154525 RepID=UPI00332B989D
MQLRYNLTCAADPVEAGKHSDDARPGNMDGDEAVPLLDDAGHVEVPVPGSVFDEERPGVAVHL